MLIDAGGGGGDISSAECLVSKAPLPGSRSRATDQVRPWSSDNASVSTSRGAECTPPAAPCSPAGASPGATLLKAGSEGHRSSALPTVGPRRRTRINQNRTASRAEMCTSAHITFIGNNNDAMGFPVESLIWAAPPATALHWPMRAPESRCCCWAVWSARGRSTL
jgi:hypothetical protein